jgi:hypothetical protein
LASSPNRFAASAVPVLLLISLVLGGCVACAEPMETKSAAVHPCCDPKGPCKPAPDDMDHAQCEGSQALLADVVKPELSTDFALLAFTFEPVCLAAVMAPIAILDSSPPISPLQQSSVLRI